MVLAIEGHGFFSASTPSTPLPVNSCEGTKNASDTVSNNDPGWVRTFPVVGSKIAGSIPKKGTVAEPAFVSMAPGKGVTTIDPVSVCLLKSSVSTAKRKTVRLYSHQKVSTMAHC